MQTQVLSPEPVRTPLNRNRKEEGSKKIYQQSQQRSNSQIQQTPGSLQLSRSRLRYWWSVCHPSAVGTPVSAIDCLFQPKDSAWKKDIVLVGHQPKRYCGLFVAQSRPGLGAEHPAAPPNGPGVPHSSPPGMVFVTNQALALTDSRTNRKQQQLLPVVPDGSPHR